jgi:hypothetical protein
MPPEIGYFEHPKLLIGNAREHLQRLEVEGEAFFKRNPYAVVIDTDLDTRENIYKARFPFRLPGKLPVYVFDVLVNLRAALDQAVCASMMTLYGPDVRLKGLYFPFADRVSELDPVIKRRCKNVPAEIVAVLRSFRPYKGGNDLLWALNRLSAENRHQRLIAVGANSSALGQIPDPAIWDSMKNEIIFARVAPDTELENDFDLSFYIAFGDIEIVRTQPLVGTFKNLTSIVTSIVRASEVETGRLLATG